MMIALLISMAAANDPLPPHAAVAAKEPTRYCRAAVSSKQRHGYLICRTRADWARWEECNRATRYCAPRSLPAGVTIGKSNTAFPLNDSSKILCRPVRVTGTRLVTQEICLPKREWARLHTDTREGVLKLQEHSTRAPSEGGGRR